MNFYIGVTCKLLHLRIPFDGIIIHFAFLSWLSLLLLLDTALP